MGQPDDDIRARTGDHSAPHNQHSRSFGAVLQTEMQIILPDLPIPPVEPSNDPDDVESADDAERAEARLEATMIAAIDQSDTNLAALCISGGGIRSASFALGLLQGLARFKLLGQFHYLSTVSGGGYIGSWLSAWRSINNDQAVFAALNAAEVEGRDRPQIAGIRADSNYLTPTLGLLSADTWTVIVLYVRNLLLNWSLFFTFFTGCLLIPHLCYAVLRYSQHLDIAAAPFVLAGRLLLTTSLSFAVYGRFRMQHRWLTKGLFLTLVLAPLVASAMCFTAAAEVSRSAAETALAFCFDPGDLVVGGACGMLIYGAAWVIGRGAAGKRGGKILPWDLLCWIVAGGVVGVLISAGMEIMAWNSQHAHAVVVLGLSAIMLAYLAGDILYAGIASFSPRGDIDREWLARAAGWLSAIAVTWAVLSAIVLYAPHELSSTFGHLKGSFELGVGGLSGVATLLLGSSARTAATRAAETLKSVPVTRLASAAALVFALFLMSLLSLLGQQLAAALGSDSADPSIALDVLLIVILIGGAFIISLFVNVNRFSMHALYRNRLVRAFLGSARAARRRPDPYTGFDARDNLRMADVTPVGEEGKLFHVINATLNVTSSDNPAWQERKAESFAITRLFSGNPFVRYQPTATYGGRRGGISLGTAMAISGAAVSPNMGYHSSPLVGFLLMLFNVRLGWWLGNPKRKQFRLEGPFWGIVPALKELAGATTAEGTWIYLSDGGHFENLGLYEMIRRRCRCIVVSDASSDPDCTFQDLANAVRKIYIDFGVSIEFEKLNIKSRKDKPAVDICCAVGSIKYPGSDKPGWLLYIKPTYDQTINRADVRGYAAQHPEFPHESTADQWFSESQLEAYRALGANTIERISTTAMTLEEFKAAAEKYVSP